MRTATCMAHTLPRFQWLRKARFLFGDFVLITDLPFANWLFQQFAVGLYSFQASGTTHLMNKAILDNVFRLTARLTAGLRLTKPPVPDQSFTRERLLPDGYQFPCLFQSFCKRFAVPDVEFVHIYLLTHSSHKCVPRLRVGSTCGKRSKCCDLRAQLIHCEIVD